MIRGTSRHIGLYRPLGFGRNKFFCFHTKNPDNHYNAICRQYNKSETLEMTNALIDVFGLTIPNPLVVYTKFSYTDYESIHSKLVERFDGRCEIKYSNIKFWPVVTIENNDYVVVEDLDKFIIENILDTKE